MAEHTGGRKRHGDKLAKIVGCIVLGLLIAVVLSVLTGNKEPDAQSTASGTVAEAPKASPMPSGTPLPYTIVNQELDKRSSGRHRLAVQLIPSGDQSRATQADLAATVMSAAQKLQAEKDVAVVNVSLLCQKASNPFGELRLAFAIYIPDGKGYSGSQDIGPWDMVMAAERGFTGQELEYLRLWADMRGSFQNDGMTDEEALDKAISAKMGVPPDSMKPFYNVESSLNGPQ